MYMREREREKERKGEGERKSEKEKKNCSHRRKEMDSKNRVQILGETVYISLSNNIEKGMDPSFILPATGNKIEETELFNFAMASGLR